MQLLIVYSELAQFLQCFLQMIVAKLLEVFFKELSSREQFQSIKSREPSPQIIGSRGKVKQ